MGKIGKNGKGLKRVLEWLLNRDVLDSEIAEALGRPATTYSRRKDAEDFPSFEELEQIGSAFGINPRWLQVEFSYLEAAELNHLGQLVVTPTPEPVRKVGRPRKNHTAVPKISELWFSDPVSEVQAAGPASPKSSRKPRRR